MKTKIVKDYIYNGLLFPITISKVEMVYYDGQWQPKIDVLKLSDQVIKKLASQQNRLTGDQIKFIRNYFNMSLRKFAEEVVSESHNAVAKWENGSAIMDINIERAIRLYICDKVINSNFRENYREIDSISKKNASAKTKAETNKKEMLIL